ncbi:MAG: hypothetical protein RSB70_02890 [Clostridium sp.]
MINGYRRARSSQKNASGKIVDKYELKQSLCIEFISLAITYITIFALILGTMDLKRTIIQTSDKINGTNYSEGIPDTLNILLLANKIFVLSGIVIFIIALNDFKKQRDKSPNSVNNKNLSSAYIEVIASALVLFVAAIRDIVLKRNINNEAEIFEEETTF